MIDVLVIGVVAAVFAVVFYAMWSVYYVVEALAGPIAARVLTYGAWFMPAPLTASLVKKKLSALLGEFTPALLESILPAPGGLTNALYGLSQGFFSEIAYVVFRYRRYGVIQAVLAGALAGIPAVILDAVLYGAIYPWDLMALIFISAVISGSIYGVIAYYVAISIRRR